MPPTAGARRAGPGRGGRRLPARPPPLRSVTGAPPLPRGPSAPLPAAMESTGSSSAASVLAELQWDDGYAVPMASAENKALEDEVSWE